MSLQQLDDVLKVWKTRLSAIAENLLELQSDSTYQSLTGTGGLQRSEIAGATEATVGPVLRSMHVLFAQFGLLQSNIDRAEKLRQGLPAIFGSEAKLREIEHLLFARSIEVDATSTPLAQRQLLAEARVAEQLTAEELLDRMTRTFLTVRDAVAVVNRAWMDFAARADRVEGELARLRLQGALPTQLLAPALDAIKGRLASTQAQVKTDPVGAVTVLEQVVEPALAAESRKVVAGEKTSHQLRAARGRLEQIRQTHTEAAGRVAEIRFRFAADGWSAGTVSDETFQGLVEWLHRLEQRFELGALDPVVIGVKNWTAAAERCLQQDQTALAACEARLASRGELRGRLHALKAKAEAYGVAGGARVLAVGSDAEHLLYSRPLDLQEAARAVAQYETLLRAARHERDAHGRLGPQ